MAKSNKSVKNDRSVVWLFAAPFLMFGFVILIQISSQLILFNGSTGSNNTAKAAVNLSSLIFGMLAFLSIILITFLFVTGLLRTGKARPDGTKQLSRVVAIVLAIFIGPFAWLYTYKQDYFRFWLNIVLIIVTLGASYSVAEIWAIIALAVKPSIDYDYYPTGIRSK